MGFSLERTHLEQAILEIQYFLFCQSDHDSDLNPQKKKENLHDIPLAFLWNLKSTQATSLCDQFVFFSSTEHKNIHMLP